MPTAAWLTEVAKKQFQGNIVLEIDGAYYAQYAVQSGLTADQVGLINSVSVNGLKVDIRDVKTTIETLKFTMLDKDGILSGILGIDGAAWIGQQVKFYFGFITAAGFDFADYELMSTTNINSLSKGINAYSFNSKDSRGLLQKPLLRTFSQLDGSISDVETGTLSVVDATDFPSSGTIKIDDEFIIYTSKSGNDLTTLTRGDLFSTADSHDDGTDVFLVTKKEDHYMDIALDVILTDMGIPASLVDSTAFTDLRDGELATYGDAILYVYDRDSALEFLEDRICAETGTRLFIKSGKISIALLNQIDLDDIGSAPTITEASIDGFPSFKVNQNGIANRIIVKWAFTEGLQKYTRTTTLNDTDSQAQPWGVKELTIRLKGAQVVNGGAAIASDMGQRLLNRLRNPRATVDVTTHLDKININVGDDVILSHRYLPSAGGGLGFYSLLEVLSKAPTGLASNSKVKYTLSFTDYSGIRVGLISPSPDTSTSSAANKITVPDGTCYEVGYFCRLWDTVTQSYLPDADNEIIAIDGNELTFQDDWVSSLGSTVLLFFSDYDESSDLQRARYAYVAPDTNEFVIGTVTEGAYQIFI